MCTLTWKALHEGGYDLFFNRDELNTRGAEQSPCLESIAGISFAAPRDTDRGGTWLVTNAHGLTVALLNDYACRWRPAESIAVSRGALVMSCATASSPEAALAMIDNIFVERVGPFKLVVLGANGQGIRLHWDGQALTEEKGETLSFETSSSFNTAVVCEARRRQFEILLAGRQHAGSDELTAFHWRHDADNGAASVLMRRPDARTRSVTRVSVREAMVEMHYEPVDHDGCPIAGGGATIRFPRL
ncbi:MAG TPA: NRDE family protein [Rariglobus sp.]|jgi:hypothetical protein|nr:NRDE family protein [Rariglobus sp.]